MKVLNVKERFSCIKSVQTVLKSGQRRRSSSCRASTQLATVFLCFGFQTLLDVTLLGNIVVSFDKYWDFPLSLWLSQDRSAICATLAWHEV